MGENILEYLARDYVWGTAVVLAAILVLTWLLRAPPIGQAIGEEEDAGAPRAHYRNRVVAATVFGLLLLGAGGFVAVKRGVPWSFPFFAAGFGLVFAMIRVNLRYRHASPSLRRLVTMSDAILNGALLLGVLIIANVLAFKYGGRAFDFTDERTFSLADLTSKQLRDLKKPVKFIVIYGRAAQAGLNARECIA